MVRSRQKTLDIYGSIATKKTLDIYGSIATKTLEIYGSIATKNFRYLWFDRDKKL
jgi:hypothetical protein